MLQSELEVATLGKTHGLDGFLRVISFSGETRHLEKLSSLVLVFKNGERKSVEVVEKKKIKSELYFKFLGYENPEKAKLLTSSIVVVPRSDALPLKKGEYYIADLLQSVVYLNGKRVGVVTSTAEGGQGLLLIIKKDENGKEYYVPNLREFVSALDLENNRLELLKGELLD